MSLDSARYRGAVAAIDSANAQDPNLVEYEGTDKSLALAQGMAATRWIEHLVEDPSEALLLAGRAHHLRRWEVPRSSYPEGRSGYLSWRRDRRHDHASGAASILTAAGYDEESIQRVQDIIEKRSLKSDSDVQTFEDAVTLVFLELQLEETVESLGPKAEAVLGKALRKMSPGGLKLAATLPGVDVSLAEKST